MERRKARREPTRIAASFRQRSGSWRENVLVRDLSPHGCRISAEALSLRSDGWLRLPSIEDWFAHVAWSAQDMVGLDFMRAMHPAVTSMLLQRAVPLPETSL